MAHMRKCATLLQGVDAVFKPLIKALSDRNL